MTKAESTRNCRSVTLADNGASNQLQEGGKRFPPYMQSRSVTLIENAVCFIIVFMLVIWAGLAQAELNARLNTDRISMGETVQLQIEAEGQLTDSPDTERLTKDFEVVGVASGSRVNLINGRMEAHSTWSITLSPRHSGRLTIPSLELNGEQTRPLSLQVSEVPVMDGAAGGNPVYIETEVDRSDPYVQGMVLYTQRLFYEVKLMNGRLSEPELDNALVRRLGKDKEYHVERDGHHYRVLKRQYAIFPQASGKLELPAPVLDARIPDKSAKRNSLLEDLLKREPFMNGSRLNDMYTVTRPIRVRGKPTTLQVQPRPAQMQARHWLPAENLILIESWKPERTELRVGDPLTRSIILKARGVNGEQLPELDPGYVDGFKVYPDRSQSDTLDLNQGVEGEKTQHVAFVPLRPGSYTLPAVKLYWWDTRSDQERVAELPERQVEVLPALTGQGLPGQTSSVPAPTVEHAQVSVPEAELAAAMQSPHAAGLAGPTDGRILPEAGIWPWISLLFGLLWLATLVIWWRGRGSVTQINPSIEQHNSKEADAAQARSRFLSACRANDAGQARRSLLQWAAAHWPGAPPVGLDELARRLDDPQLVGALQALDRTLYRGDSQSWDGSFLAQRLNKLPKQKPATGDRTPLPDLYV